MSTSKYLNLYNFPIDSCSGLCFPEALLTGDLILLFKLELNPIKPNQTNPIQTKPNQAKTFLLESPFC